MLGQFAKNILGLPHLPRVYAELHSVRVPALARTCDLSSARMHVVLNTDVEDVVELLQKTAMQAQWFCNSKPVP